MGQTASTDVFTSRSAGVLNIIPENVWKQPVRLQNTQVDTNPVEFSFVVDENGRIRDSTSPVDKPKRRKKKTTHATQPETQSGTTPTLENQQKPRASQPSEHVPESEIQQHQQQRSQSSKKRVAIPKKIQPLPSTTTAPPTIQEEPTEEEPESLYHSSSESSVQSLEPSNIDMEKHKGQQIFGFGTSQQKLSDESDNSSSDLKSASDLETSQDGELTGTPRNDPRRVVIIDFGHQTTKVGYSGEDRPRLIIPSCYTVSTVPAQSGEPAKKTIKFGGTISRFDSTWFLKHGKFSFKRNDPDQQIFVAYLRYISKVLLDLKNAFRGKTVMISLPYLFGEDKEQLRILCECFFHESVQAKSLFLCGCPLFSFLSAAANHVTENRTTGLSVTVGHGISEIVPIVEGCPFSTCGSHSYVCGSSQSEFVLSLIKSEVQRQGETLDEELVTYENVEKEKMDNCTLVRSFRVNKKHPNECKAKFFKKTFEPVKGDMLVVLDHRYLTPELLFTPKIFIKEELQLGEDGKTESEPNWLGIVALIETCLKKCPKEFHEILLSNVIVSGGPAQVRNFSERVKYQLKRKCDIIVNPLSDIKPNKPPYDLSAWYGMSFLSSAIDVDNRELDGLHCRILLEETRLEHYSLEDVLLSKKLC
ncbi:actin-related protein ARP3 [Naegleria gruberi]|uniref:Actin-related protein ARP3 n=1 Tax=Naegleria gruberi TaxID=5762 RepID=D2VPR0_NAEGR|nr:actin-related protein ARP3 [Naegleria gruberi]EFC41172.1 actin-related protein ARP3 [Naegleria gruberi]|eukprot:XP_002673916.1 actin-related protein ARP3 [Naegleria gruberi strain NEG-M]